MMSKTEADILSALEEVLKLHDIKLQEPTPLPVENETLQRQADYAEIISKTQDRLDTLNEKAEEIFKRTGMTREQLDSYATNPNNFSKEQWESLQKVREACDRYVREARQRINDPRFEQKTENRSREKQTHRFAKKKQWLPS